MTATVEHAGGAMGRARAEPDLSTYSGRVAARTRELREDHGLTVDDLAAKVGVAVQTMYGYENGKSRIPPDLYPRFAAAFGITVRAYLPKE